ncbi:hypothetical protein NYE69_07085 [Paenibacillus sp. FSL R5-0527]|uniref:hypothetical protein n=1 Tax=Paenibacillus sp. FSL R5-0527 TaxID=2975321 RepID=UPI00097AFEA4|nr:hypothetical protein BK140_09485 [Paenibacillus macerans]
MLNDLERKLLRILSNFSTQRKRMPTVVELEKKTGRNQRDIFEGLRGLVEQQYIFWPDNPRLDTIVILEAWERGTEEAKKVKPTTSNIDYYLYY